jgi:siroheme synthase-like protein
MTTPLLPLFVSVEGALVVVTGAGPSALSAARRLREHGARVRLVALTAPAVVEGCDVVVAAPAAAHLDGALLLVTAHDDAALDAGIAEAARARGMFVVSAVPGGRAYLGTSVQQGRVALAATASGSSAALEARIVRDAARTLDPRHDRLAGILGALRVKLEERYPDESRRDAIWEQILDSPVMVLLETGAEEEAVEMAERMAWGTG